MTWLKIELLDDSVAQEWRIAILLEARWQSHLNILYVNGLDLPLLSEGDIKEERPGRYTNIPHFYKITEYDCSCTFPPYLSVKAENK